MLSLAHIIETALAVLIANIIWYGSLAYFYDDEY